MNPYRSTFSKLTIRTVPLRTCLFLFSLILPMFVTLHATDTCNGKRLIGANTTITLPDFNLSGIPAKVDTGARTSSLHCTAIHIDAEASSVTFIPLGKDVSHTVPLYRIGSVKSSNGAVQERPFVFLKIIHEGVPFETEFSLADRSAMTYPVLLGRSLLKGNFIVDVAK